LRLMHPLDHSSQCSLSRTAAADDTSDFSFWNRERYIVESWSSSWIVAERDAFELHLAVDDWTKSAANSRFFIAIHDRAKHADRKCTLLIRMNKRYELNQWTRYAARDHLEGNQFTD